MSGIISGSTEQYWSPTISPPLCEPPSLPELIGVDGGELSNFFKPLAPQDEVRCSVLVVKSRGNLRLTLRNCPVESRVRVGREGVDESSLPIRGSHYPFPLSYGGGHRSRPGEDLTILDFFYACRAISYLSNSM